MVIRGTSRPGPIQAADVANGVGGFSISAHYPGGIGCGGDVNGDGVGDIALCSANWSAQRLSFSSLIFVWGTADNDAVTDEHVLRTGGWVADVGVAGAVSVALVPGAGDIGAGLVLQHRPFPEEHPQRGYFVTASPPGTGVLAAIDARGVGGTSWPVPVGYSSRAAYDLAASGDLDGDGAFEAIVAYPESGTDGRGVVYAISPTEVPPDEGLVLPGEPSLDAFAESVSSGHDVDGDGAHDLHVGVIGSDDGNGGPRAGAYLFFSGAELPPWLE